MTEEEKIIVVIDKDGNLKAEVKGIPGPSCVDEVSKLLEEIAEIQDMKKTDEYYMEPKVLEKRVQKEQEEVRR